MENDVKYFKNTQLAQLYHVSEKSVRNWIQATQAGKLDLQLYEENGRFYVANTSKNNALIESLVQKGKKYKNTRGFKTVTPSPSFYATYTQKQILDIISNLTIRHEIPLQYSYLDKGANFWDDYLERLNSEENPNLLNRTMQLLDMASPYVDDLLESASKVNIVDLGPSNGIAVRPTVERLLKEDRLGKYIAIDISQDLLRILEANLREWFGGRVTFEGHQRDISFERFGDLLVDESDDTASLVFFFGASLNNYRSPDQVLQTINSSLGLQDVLLYNGYLDTPYTRRYFDFNTSDSPQTLAFNQKIIPAFLGIEDALYEVEHRFSEAKQARFTIIKPKVDLLIDFRKEHGVKPIELRKNHPILTYRHRHYGATDLIDLFDKNHFDLQLATKSKEQDYIVLIARIKTTTEPV